MFLHVGSEGRDRRDGEWSWGRGKVQMDGGQKCKKIAKIWPHLNGKPKTYWYTAVQAQNAISEIAFLSAGLF